MRFTKAQHNAIRDEVTRLFGPNVRGCLFGSRMDDDPRGVDIHRPIERSGTAADSLNPELHHRSRPLCCLGEWTIDSVVRDDRRPLWPIEAHARQTGVAL